MDILNFISWIKAGEYRDTLPTDVSSLIAIGAKDSSRDDGFRSLAINAAPLQAIYDTANVTQVGSVTSSVTVNAHNGIITTLTSTLSPGASTLFTVNNNKVTLASKILLTVDSNTTGIPVLITKNLANGSFVIKINNADVVGVPLNKKLFISYLILD